MPTSSPPSSDDLDRTAAVIAEAVCQRLESCVADRLGELVRSPAPMPLADVPDLARYLNVSERTVERIVASDKLRPLWIEGQRRFTPAAIEAYLKTCAKENVRIRRRRRGR